MTLLVYAISIDEVRDMFGADETLSARLRGIAAAKFPPPPDPRPGLLGKLGPLFRRDPTLIVDPAQPTAQDVSALLSGRFTPLDRLDASWQVVHAWLRELSWGCLEVNLGRGEVDDLEFDLAKAGLPSQYAIGALLGNDAQLPLQPPPGTSVGYAKCAHVMAMRDALADVRDEVAEAHQPTLQHIETFLTLFGDYVQQAASSNRSAPDVLAIWGRT